MGAWGTALYSDDTAGDVRDICNEVYALADPDTAEQIIFSEYKEILESDTIDNDYAVFWYALADWQWNHGILSDTTKAKALDLLRVHAGIGEWIEAGDQKNVEKRIAVLDKLYQKLSSPQPPKKLPKARLAKPKHKPGDIIIFRACPMEQDPDNDIWNIERCAESYLFADPEFEKSPSILDPPYDAHGKYMAILCVGSEKMPHSQYVDGFEDEHSTYAFYDYLSDTKPTAADLINCGFLPRYLRYAKIDGSSIERSGWTYTFQLFACSFRKTQKSTEEIVEKCFCGSEPARFSQLLGKKEYLSEAAFHFELFDAFSAFFEEKVRLLRIGKRIDNLLDEKASNPALKTPREIDALIHEQVSREVEALFRNRHNEGE